MSFWRGLELPAGLLKRRLALLDAGARGGLQWPWDRLPADAIEVTFVEPDSKEAARLQSEIKARGSGRVLETALWSTRTTVQLHVNRSPGTSSVLKPNREFLDQFPDATRFDTLSTVTINARTVDDLCAQGQLPYVDVAKIDVQGGELEIINGATRFAHQLVGLEVEVAFCEQYVGQPLFADVDRAARSLGLELWDLRKTYWKYERGVTVAGPQKGRAVVGDALYLRPLSGLPRWLEEAGTDAGNKLMMLIVTALAYGYADYAAAIAGGPAVAKFIDPGSRVPLQRAIESLGSGVRIAGSGNRYLYWFFHLLAAASRPSYGGWAIPGSGLGSRRRGPFWS